MTRVARANSVGLIGIGAVTSVFLREIASGPLATGGFSVFHIITAVVLVVLPLGVLAARTHRVRWHAALMIYLLVNVVLGRRIARSLSRLQRTASAARDLWPRSIAA